ncbi:hypothetical protein FQN49_000885 [Arthroderma sp. PD_2]|nr:hypothetical protein FQN49_000885 [Arthroderma sp. PD_2]
MDERTRLLQSRSTGSTSPNPPFAENDGDTTRPSDQAWYLRFYDSKWMAEVYDVWKIPILCYVFALLVDLADNLRTTPKTQLFETILCYEYYPHRLDSTIMGMPEELCKSDEIQGQLISLKARLKVIEIVFALILAIPLGNLANTRGRVFVLVLGTVGQMLSEIWILIVAFLGGGWLPFGSVYISSLLKSASGGGMVISAIIHAILSDVIPSDRRSQAFFYIASILLIAEVIAPVLGSVLMQTWNVYAPLAFALIFELLGGVVLFMLPNTVKLATEDGDASEEDETNREHGGVESESHVIWTGLKTSVKHAVAPFVLVWRIISGNRDVFFSAISFLVLGLGREILDFLVQYTSKRFGWSLAEANYLISFRAAANLILLLLVLPFLTRFFTHYLRMSPAHTDLWIARGSSIFSIIGSIMMGLSPSPGLLVLCPLSPTFKLV